MFVQYLQFSKGLFTSVSSFDFFLISPRGRESGYCYLQMTDEGPVAQVPVNLAQGFTTTK